MGLGADVLAGCRGFAADVCTDMAQVVSPTERLLDLVEVGKRAAGSTHACGSSAMHGSGIIAIRVAARLNRARASLDSAVSPRCAMYMYTWLVSAAAERNAGGALAPGAVNLRCTAGAPPPGSFARARYLAWRSLQRASRGCHRSRASWLRSSSPCGGSWATRIARNLTAYRGWLSRRMASRVQDAESDVQVPRPGLRRTQRAYRPIEGGLPRASPRPEPGIDSLRRVSRC